MPAAPTEPPVLFVDAATPLLAAGLQAEVDGPISWQTSQEEAGVGLFRLVERLLGGAEVPMTAVRSVVFCEGPGSLLGIRIAAMALRTWLVLPRAFPLRVSAYRSLELVAADLLSSGTPPPFLVVSDARRASWNRLDVDAAGTLGAIHRWPAAEPFPDRLPVFCVAGLPLWQPRPPGAADALYRPERLPALAARFPLLREVAEPDAFLTELPTYRPWPGSVDLPTRPPAPA
jgi:tRNA threonylcarbamoyladenosine biosynthesis protein TsaB